MNISTQETKVKKPSRNTAIVTAILADHNLLEMNATDAIATLVATGIVPPDTPEQAFYQARSSSPEVRAIRESIKEAKMEQSVETATADVAAAADTSDKANVAMEEAAVCVDEDPKQPAQVAKFFSRFPSWGRGAPDEDVGEVVGVASRDGVSLEEHEAAKGAAKPSVGIAAAVAVPFVWAWKALCLPICTGLSRLLTGWHVRKVQCDTAGQAFYRFIATSKVVVAIGVVSSLLAYQSAAYLTLLYVSLCFIAFRAVWHAAMYVCGAFTAAEAGYRHVEGVVVDQASKTASAVSSSLESQTEAAKASV